VYKICLFSENQALKEKVYDETLNQEKTDLKKQFGIYIDMLSKTEEQKLELMNTLMDPYNNLSLGEIQFYCQAINNKLVKPEDRMFYYETFYKKIVEFFNNTTGEKALRTSVELIPWSDDTDLQDHIKKLENAYEQFNNKNSRAKSRF